MENTQNRLGADRLAPLDIFRGIIIALMALDHASILVGKMHAQEFWGSALPQYESIFIFLTRALTHICAPGFSFLMGIGMIFFWNSRKNQGWHNGKVTATFWRRGLVMLGVYIVAMAVWYGSEMFMPVEKFVMRGGRIPGLFTPGFKISVDVLLIWSVSIFIASFLLRIKSFMLLFLSIILILLTQFTVPGTGEIQSAIHPLAGFLFIAGHAAFLVVKYPLVPWFAIVLLGMFAGKNLLKNKKKTLPMFLPVGIALLAIFFIIRWINGFGNIHPRAGGIIGWLNVTKYPPDLSFLSLTLGIILIIIYFLSKINSDRSIFLSILKKFGQVPLFFFALHPYVYFLLGFPFKSGVSLPLLYTFWLAGIAIMYLPCVWFYRFKQKKSLDSFFRLI